MSETKKRVIIVGGGSVGKSTVTSLIAARLIELQKAHPDMLVVTLDEAKKQGLTETFEITAPEPLDLGIFEAPETRTERRKRLRKK